MLQGELLFPWKGFTLFPFGHLCQHLSEDDFTRAVLTWTLCTLRLPCFASFQCLSSALSWTRTILFLHKGELLASCFYLGPCSQHTAKAQFPTFCPTWIEQRLKPGPCMWLGCICCCPPCAFIRLGNNSQVYLLQEKQRTTLFSFKCPSVTLFLSYQPDTNNFSPHPVWFVICNMTWPMAEWAFIKNNNNNFEMLWFRPVYFVKTTGIHMMNGVSYLYITNWNIFWENHLLDACGYTVFSNSQIRRHVDTMMSILLS